jgi:hypothetical protein
LSTGSPDESPKRRSLSISGATTSTTNDGVRGRGVPARELRL